MTGILDRLPAPVRHAVLVFVGSFLSALIPAVSNAVSGTAVDWAKTVVDALGLAVAAAFAAVGIAAVTPVTTQYGVGSVTPGSGPVDA